MYLLVYETLIEYIKYCDLISISFRSKGKKTERRRKEREVGGRERRRKRKKGMKGRRNIIFN